MKQLKFMLAAATALGLATASQAADFANSTDFESYDIGAFLGGAGWQVVNASDNDSEIVGETMEGVSNLPTKYRNSGHTKALQVNTGKDPILRYIKTNANGVGPFPVTLGDASKVYIDTMVQFTVTPAGDEPVPGPDDKLMLYAKEVTTGEGENTVTTTKLHVIASSFSPGDNIITPDQYSTNHVDTGLAISTNVWYRLTVMSFADNENAGLDVNGDSRSINLFKIFVNGEALRSGTPLYNCIGVTSDAALFPSIQGAVSGNAVINSVGFAGEGKVDDLVLTSDDPFVVVTDFTFTIKLDEGVSSVTYTIGRDSVTINKDSEVRMAQDASVTIEATASDWYKIVSGEGEFEVSEITDNQILVKAEGVGATDLDVEVPTGTPPETVNAALAWAKDKGKSTDAVKDAANIVANYLLNVENLAVEPKIKITSIDLSGDVPTVTAEVTAADGTTTIKTLTAKNINAAASIKYKAAATLKDLKNATAKEAIEAGDKFIQVVVE